MSLLVMSLCPMSHLSSMKMVLRLEKAMLRTKQMIISQRHTTMWCWRMKHLLLMMERMIW
ncbi:hypothetical protein H5410_064816 [Solanum commersonii]|uniref:Uncharacterized protein n=1 Tax=Solanum commersonii TaxID=4109 RepID=A0A9J5VYN0_SOLCO|nr:hypothetical protein H5410_064816 [Solanum commersonii]